ncbi:MAG: hypothetical protein O3B47_03005, partial [bacterium]|nr:hypothetical protein [bacterium]
ERISREFKNNLGIFTAENPFKLIQNSEGVCTIGSTMGFEAILLGKPTILLGEPWYRSLPGIYKADTPEVMAELLQNIWKLRKLNEAEKVQIVYALFDIGFEGVKLPRENALSEENIGNLSKGLAEFLFK